MKKFDFSEYKNSKIYFQMFDVLIREKVPNRDHFLIDNDIPASSYRRCRTIEQNVGRDIINKLANLLNLKTNTDEEIDQLEKFANKVYYQMTYKIYKSFEEDIEYIKKLLDENNILFPILELLLLFLYMNQNKTVSDVIEENVELFKKVKKYNVFLIGKLNELYELVVIYFTGANKEELYLKTYDNAIAYTILSAQAYNRGDYIACLYFSNKAKEISEKEGNIKRILQLNRNIMTCLLYIGNYEECYELAYRQILILQSIDTDDNMIKSAKKHLTISALGMEKYNKIIELLNNCEQINLTELTCLMIALFKTDKKEYEVLLKDRIEYLKADNDKINYINNLNLFLKKRDKKYSIKLDSNLIMSPLKKIFKKMLES